MPTYVYQVVADDPDAAPETFEVRQSMRDAALTHHPVSGRPARRLLSGGFGLMKAGSGRARSQSHAAGTCCPGCHD